MTIKGEPTNQKLDEIESGIIKPKCWNCGAKQTKLVLMLDGNRRTQSYIGICTNPACFRWPRDREHMPSWVPA
jgi:hypothetical protein